MGRLAQIGGAVLLFAGLVAGCGRAEVPDRPSDCNEDEFFEQSSKQCISCPAVEPPEDCPDGCGWRVFEGENGCERAECAPDCDLCSTGSRFAEEDGVCEPCPGRPDCDELNCRGELRIEGTFRAPCPPPSAYACGECSSPREGCGLGDGGACVDPQE